VAAARAAILAGGEAPMPALLIDEIAERVNKVIYPKLTRVINATGVIIHTNLGRAPLSDDAIKAMQNVALSYSNLEYDLEAGERGSRYEHAEDLLTRLTGAEAALVVNNNAAAVMFVLRVFAENREVVLARGELVEIGGGFRVPDVLKQSGAQMVEVGTTNRTYIHDYANAVSAATAVLLRVHHSNFKIVGFAHQATLAELAALRREKNLMVVDDLGSGALLDTAQFGLAHEPTPQEDLKAGADLVCFSGDKLLGGPQAGIIVGKKEPIARLKKHPLARALRVDKFTLSGLQATLLHYLKNEATKKIPIWRMIAVTRDELDAKAQAWVTRLKAFGLDAQVIDAESTVGGGSLPGEVLPTRAMALQVKEVDAFAQKLRANYPPIVARVENDRVLFDPRTVLALDEEVLLAGIERASKIGG
jgi:L-seryl-tRNA(Ser) seleniumtransferase